MNGFLKAFPVQTSKLEFCQSVVYSSYNWPVVVVYTIFSLFLCRVKILETCVLIIEKNECLVTASSSIFIVQFDIQIELLKVERQRKHESKIMIRVVRLFDSAFDEVEASEGAIVRFDHWGFRVVRLFDLTDVVVEALDMLSKGTSPGIQDKSAASFCRQVAAWARICFATFIL